MKNIRVIFAVLALVLNGIADVPPDDGDNDGTGWILTIPPPGTLPDDVDLDGPVVWAGPPSFPGGTGTLAEALTPEIAALARGLKNDPKQIFDFVHDHIRYVHYFGSKKGAQLTLLERSGNDFDQCALLMALLRAAGQSASYQFGIVSVPYQTSDHRDYQHWLGLTKPNTNWTEIKNLVNGINNIRGYPWFAAASGSTNNVTFHRTWVSLAIGGTNCALDPAFKVSEPIAGIDLHTAAGIDTNGLLSAAAGVATADYVWNLNETSLRSALQTCNGVLLTTLAGSYSNANASVEQITGGQRIVSSFGDPLGAPLEFSIPATISGIPNTISQWDYIPTNLMSVLTLLQTGMTNQFLVPTLAGERLSLTFDANGLEKAWLGDTNLSSWQTTGSSARLSMTLQIDHPHSQWTFNAGTNTLTGNHRDGESASASYARTNANYALLYAFEMHPDWLRSRQDRLDAYQQQQGLASSSREVVTETLEVMGLNWMVQTALAENLLATQAGMLSHYYHRLGRMAQETGKGYYIDAYMNSSGTVPATGLSDADVQRAVQFLEANAYISSALEHGVIEQLQSSGLTAASTVKILQLANSLGLTNYLANSTNWTAGANVSGQITNYNNVSSLNSTYITPGYNLLLPQNGAVLLAGAGSWQGYGYVAEFGARQIITMGISPGGYNGGYVSNPDADIDSDAVDDNAHDQSDDINKQSTFTPGGGARVADPVNIADGSFRVSQTDLALGQAEPRGLSFSRAYSSSRRLFNQAGLANGWVHNYYFHLAEISGQQPGLGTTTPAQAAPMLVATRAIWELYRANGGPKNWLVTALIAKWGVDQLLTNAVSISLGEDTIEFIRQPDGSFTPPANCTYTLTNISGNYVLQERHGNTFNFDSSKRLANITDQYGRGMVFSYNASNWVSSVTDWTNRALTFSYSGTPLRLMSVADTNRSVSLTYSTAYSSQGDLIAVTDPEGKTSRFAYDTNHQILLVSNAVASIVSSNVYDGFGRVILQASQGDPNQTWQMFWSGFVNTAQDPFGGQTLYFYDDKIRQVAQQDALGNLRQMAYDGQDHVVTNISPMGEISRFVYDGRHNLLQSIDPLNKTNFNLYDSSDQLISATDPRGNTSSFGYNTKHQLTASTNGAGDWVTYSFNSSDGNLAARVDAGGTTSYSYDNWGQLQSVAYPGSLGTEWFTNNASGDVLGHLNARGFATTFAYNLCRQPTSSTGPTNLTASLGYDAVGNQTVATNALGFKSTNFWSPTRKLLGAALPVTAQGEPTVTNVYDVRDWLARSLDPLQHATTNLYDLAGRVLAVTDPLLRTSHVGYDADGHPLAATNAVGEFTSQIWNARGQQMTNVDAAGKQITRGYDDAGNQITLTNRLGKRWQFFFDAANRLTNTTTPLGRVAGIAFNAQGLVAAVKQPTNGPANLGYDARNRLTSRADDVGTTTYGYDANSNPTTVAEAGKTNLWTYDAYDRPSTYTDSDGNVIQYGYDVGGNLTSLVYPGSRTVTYTYDSLNRLATVTDWSGRQSTITYDLASRVTSLSRPNGTMRTLAYDDDGETTQIVERATADGMAIAYFKLNWTNSGRVQSEFIAPLPQAYTPPTRTMTYNDDNQLATFNSTAVVHDLNGNMTTGPLTNGGAFTTHVYDARNRLRSVGGVSYGYDPAGNRTSITNGTDVTRFVINPNASLPQVLMRVRTGITNYYIYGPGLLYEIDETATTTNTLTYHYDYRGSTVALTGDHTVTDRIEYSAYGTISYRTGTNDTPFLYNGQFGVVSDSNGLLYMRARYYNPYLCRFLNADPSGFSGGMNFYAYADGNPISSLDPFGLGDQSQTMSISLLSNDKQLEDNAATAAQNSLTRAALGLDFNPNVHQLSEPSSSTIILMGIGPTMAAAQTAIAATAAESGLGGGTTFTHFTDATGLEGITGVRASTIASGDTLSVGQLRFGMGSNPYMASAPGDIFVTDLSASASAGELNGIGVFGARQSFGIQFSQETAFANGIRPAFQRPGIFTIPGGATLQGTFHIIGR